MGDSSTYRNIGIRNTENLQVSYTNGKESYLHKLESNIRKMFHEESLSVVEHMHLLLNTTRLDTTSVGLQVYGEDSLKEVVEMYGKSKQLAGEETIPNLIDPEHTNNDYLQFKYFLKCFSNKSPQQVLGILCTQTLFPNFTTLVQTLSASPVTSVSCERAFSAQNLVKKIERAYQKVS